MTKQRLHSLFLWIIVSILFHYALFRFVKVEKEIPQREEDVYEVRLLYYKPPVEKPKPKRKFKKKEKMVKELVKEKKPPLIEDENKAKESERSTVEPEEVQHEAKETSGIVQKKEIETTGDIQDVVDKSVDFTSIVQELREKLYKKKIYPAAARRRGQQGVVHVLIKLDKEGNLMELSVTRSSGHKVLDNAAISLVKKVLPFKHGAGRAIAIEIPINYSLLDH
jgi:protein TonB